MLLWTILKVIGLVLLAVLLLLLFLVLVVLLVPIRYRVMGRRAGSGDYAVSAEVSWLLRLLRFRVSFDPGGLRYSLRVLSFCLWEHPEESADEKADAKTSVPSDAAEKRAEPSVRPEAAGTEEEPECPEGPEDLRGPEHSEEPEHPKEPECPKKSEGPKEPEHSEETKRPEEPERSEEPERPEKPEHLDGSTPRPRKAVSLAGKLERHIASVSERIRHVCRKLSGWRAIAEDEENQKAAARMLSQLKYLLHHMRLRSLDGELIIGSDDPELMGRVLGVLSLFYPLYEESFTIRPQFDRTVFCGECRTRGHLRLLHPVVVLIRILLNKKLRQVIFEHL